MAILWPLSTEVGSSLSFYAGLAQLVERLLYLIMNKKPPRTCRACDNYIPERHYTFCRTCILLGRHIRKAEKLSDAATDRTRRIVLIKSHGHACFNCKLSEWQGQPIPLELDHIDGNHENNLETNLRVLCPNCHAQTPTYKAKNKGNGRASRRQSI